MTIEDPEVRKIAELSQTLQKEYLPKNQDWESSPFGWIRTTQSRQRGAIGEELVSRWLKKHGFKVYRAGDSDSDRIIEGMRVEIKFSTLWRDGSYAFQQLRD